MSCSSCACFIWQWLNIERACVSVGVWQHMPLSWCVCIQVCVILSRFSSAAQACWLSVRLTSCSDAAPPHFQQEVYSWALLTVLLFCFKAPSEIASYQILPPLLRPSQTSHWQIHPSSRFQDPLILFNTVKISNFLVRPSLWSSAFNPKRAIFILS